MPERTVSIASVPLARAPMRLLVVPLVLLGAGVVSAVAGAIVSGAAGIGLVAAGGVVAVLAGYLALVLLTMRLEVEVAALHLRWLGGNRRYVLARGAVTRVPLRGPGAARLRARFGALGWAVGPATLRGSEAVEVVRLARSPSLILVPTDQGRLAVAPASEQALLDALGAAARVQQRLDEAAGYARAAAAAPVVEPEAPPGPPPAPEPAPGRLLTGIERTLLEERLAADRATALAAAEAERLAAAPAGGADRGPAADAVTAGERGAPAALRRPAWLRRPAVHVARPIIARPGWATLLPWIVAGLPLLATGAVATAAFIAGRLSLPDAELRLVGLALAVIGPGAGVGALIARTWFPRLVGLVVLTALAALLLVGRALLG
jgi:hypothetical protein